MKKQHYIAPSVTEHKIETEGLVCQSVMLDTISIQAFSIEDTDFNMFNF